MANINNKLFAYTYAPINDAELLKQYENSLIFIGKEQQIYQPLTNTYIGIGKTEFNNLKNQITDVTDNKLADVVDYITKTNTGTIYAQYSQDQWQDKTGGNLGKLGTYNSQLYTGNDIYTTSNKVVLRGANANTGINFGDNLTNVISNSGINVSIQRGTTYYNYVNPLTGEANVTYFETSYLTIDDAYTWSHISDVKTYMANYAQKVAVDQANRIYKNLLGINDTVYIEKGFNEAFTYNTVTGELTTVDGQQVYIKNKDGEFYPVTINDTDGIITYNGTMIFYRDNNGVWRPLNVNNPISYFSDFSFDDGFGSMTYYNWDGDGGNTKESVPTFYQLDSTYTAYSNINLVDGINTIKEIAYILDVITDGQDDAGINLTYTIADNYVEIEKLKAWQADIGNSSVSSIKAVSSSPVVTLTQYSSDHWNEGEATGNVVIDTKVKVAPVISGREYQKEQYNELGELGTPITDYADYAVYDPSLLTAEEQFAYTFNWVYDPNYSSGTSITSSAESGTTYSGGWFSWAGWTANENNYVKDGKFIADGSTKVWAVTNVTSGFSISSVSDIEQYGTIEETTLGSLSSSSTPYIYIPWSLPSATPALKDGVLDALTDVRWVTAYVNATYQLLNNRIQYSSGVTQAALDAKINSLDASYTVATGKYFTTISQADGILTTPVEKDLPTDFLSDDAIVTSYNISYVKATASEIKSNSLFSGKTNDLYNEDGTKANVDVSQIQPTDTTIYYVKFDNGTNGFTSLSSTYQITDINKSIYVLDGNVYKPVSIQEAIQGGGIDDDFIVQVASTYYYASDSAENSKYLNSSSFHLDSGENRFRVNAYITYVRNATPTNTGLADAYDVRKTIEDMFTWIDLRTNQPFVAGA